MIYSLLGFYLNWRAYDFFGEGHPRRWEVTLTWKNAVNEAVTHHAVKVSYNIAKLGANYIIINMQKSLVGVHLLDPKVSLRKIGRYKTISAEGILRIDKKNWGICRSDSV